jgi:hypothetical protein
MLNPTLCGFVNLVEVRKAAEVAGDKRAVQQLVVRQLPAAHEMQDNSQPTMDIRKECEFHVNVILRPSAFASGDMPFDSPPSSGPGVPWPEEA